jgi:hypothetical protein
MRKPHKPRTHHNDNDIEGSRIFWIVLWTILLLAALPVIGFMWIGLYELGRQANLWG